MKINLLLVSACAAALCCACFPPPSIYPFYTESDLATDARLEGAWLSESNELDQTSWIFEKSDGQAYSLKTTEKDSKKGKFEARFFKLKQEYFLDITPSEFLWQTNEQAALPVTCLVAGHMIFHVVQLEPTLKLASFDSDWLDRFLKDAPKALAHRSHDRNVDLLTAETPELQKFMLAHLEEGLFDSPTEFKRAKTQP